MYVFKENIGCQNLGPEKHRVEDLEYPKEIDEGDSTGTRTDPNSHPDPEGLLKEGTGRKINLSFI